MKTENKSRRTLPQGSVWTGPELLFDKSISGTDLKVFLGLCSYANSKTDTTFVGQDTLAEKLGMSRKTVSTSLKKLEDSGYITVTARSRRNERGRTTNEYEIVNKFTIEATVDIPVDEEVTPEQPVSTTQSSSKQSTLFSMEPGTESTLQSIEKMREGKDKSVAKIDAAVGGSLAYSSLTPLDICYYYQHLHNVIVGYNVSVNRTDGQSKGRKTSPQYMTQFMERYGLTTETAIYVLPKVLAEFRSLCEAEGRKKAEWYLNIGLLTWTGSNADIEKIMARVQPRSNSKYEKFDKGKPSDTTRDNTSTGIVF